MDKDPIELFIADVRSSKPGRLQQIADATGVHPKVLRNILYGETTDPRGSNKDRLRAYYEARVSS